MKNEIARAGSGQAYPMGEGWEWDIVEEVYLVCTCGRFGYGKLNSILITSIILLE